MECVVVIVSFGVLGFNNGGDDVIVEDGGIFIVSYIFGGEGGND